MWPDWLVFCDCGFHSVCTLMKKDKRLMEASWWERLTEGKLGLVLKGRAMISESLDQFSVDGWGCALSLLCTCRQTMVDVIKIMVASFKRSHAHTASQCPQPCCRPASTHVSAGDSWTLTVKLNLIFLSFYIIWTSRPIILGSYLK